MRRVYHHRISKYVVGQKKIRISDPDGITKIVIAAQINQMPDKESQ